MDLITGQLKVVILWAALMLARHNKAVHLCWSCHRSEFVRCIDMKAWWIWLIIQLTMNIVSLKELSGCECLPYWLCNYLKNSPFWKGVLMATYHDFILLYMAPPGTFSSIAFLWKCICLIILKDWVKCNSQN